MLDMRLANNVKGLRARKTEYFGFWLFPVLGNITHSFGRLIDFPQTIKTYPVAMDHLEDAGEDDVRVDGDLEHLPAWVDRATQVVLADVEIVST